MESVLSEAASTGSVSTLMELLRQDPFILDRLIVNVTLAETPLHVAALLGHTEFVKEILHQKPELARELDSKRSSPLHLASAKGYVEIVKELLAVSPDMCFASDQDGRNPLHLAAIKGRVYVLKELIDSRLQAARAPLKGGETILHLCVKQNQLEALKMLVGALNDNEFVNAMDEYGFTLLHLAVVHKQIETINFLIYHTRVEIKAASATGFTALDLLSQSRRDAKDLDISEALRGAGALKATESTPSVTHMTRATDGRHVPSVAPRGINKHQTSQNRPRDQNTKQEDWLSRKTEGLMVVASLIANMAFQAGVNPPGGLWQDDQTNGTESHSAAGTAIMADKHQEAYSQYLACNTIGFVASLSIILLLITGLPFTRRLFMWILVVMVWVAITAMAITYSIAILVFTPEKDQRDAASVLSKGVVAWSVVMVFLLVGHTIRLLFNMFRKLSYFLFQRRKPYTIAA